MLSEREKEMKKSFILSVLLIFVMLFCSCEKGADQPTNENLLKNPSFEETTGTDVAGWSLDRYDTSSPIEYYTVIEDATAPNGTNVLKIESTNFNDARFVQEVEVAPGSYYCLTAYVKTDIIQPRETDSGANIGFLQTYCKSEYVRSNTDWQKLTVYGKTGKDTKTVLVALRLGDYSADAMGTVYFDEVSLTRVEKAPDGVSVQSMDSFTFAQPEQSDDEKKTTDDDKVIMDVTVIGIALFVLLALLLFWMFKKTELNMRHLYIFAAAALIIRIIASVMYVGFKVDIGCFSSWGSMMASRGISGFYEEGMFCDYPPLYMIVLGIISSIGNLFKLNLQEGIGLALLKSPAMICDIISAIMLAKITKKHLDEKVSVLIGIGYLFLPTAIVNSAVWGQVDSILVLFMLLTFWLIDNDKFGISVVTFTIGLLLKPQAILFGPVMLLAAIHEFYVIYTDFSQKDKKSGYMRLAKGFGGLFASIGIFALLAIVMKNNQSDVTLDSGLKVNWLIGKYFETLGSYDYATLSSFGLMGLLDGQWVPSSTEVFDGITYGQLGTALMWITGFVVIGIFGYLLYTAFGNFKRNRGEGKIASGWFWLLSALMVAGAVTVSTRTHERYMFPVIAMLIMSFAHFKDIRLLAISFGYAFLNFINTAGLLFLYEEAGVYFANGDTASLNETVFKVGSFLIVALFIFQVYVTLTLMLKKETPQKKPVQEKKKQVVNAPQPKPVAESELQKLYKRRTYSLPKVTLKDIIICLVITVVYGCIAFTDLGDVKAAQNFWYADKSQVYAVVDLGEVKDFDSIKYLSASNSGIIKFYTSEDGENYSLYQTLAVNGEDQWKKVGDSGRARYIKLEANSATSIKELVILKDDKPLQVSETSQQIVPVDHFSANAKYLFDDQECYNVTDTTKYAPSTVWSSGGTYTLDFGELTSISGIDAYFTEAGQFTVAIPSSLLGEAGEWTDILTFESDGEGWVSGTLLFSDEYLSGLGSILVKNENSAKIAEIKISGYQTINVGSIFDTAGNFIDRSNDVYNCFDESHFEPGTQGSVTKGKTWNVTSVADYVVADFGEVKNIYKGYYRTSLTKGSFGVYVSEDGTNWNRQNTLSVEESNLYYWHNLSVTASARYVLITADTQYLKLVEVGFFESDLSETTIPIKEITASNLKEDGGKNLFDEQDLVPPEGATYMNSMYFDEIYHARTAYESANGHSIYEWTHPPLGKDMMSWCVSLMGMTPFAWRFAGVVAGILMVPAMYFIGLLMFKKTSWATATAMLMAFDGMHYAQTRIATIDSFGVLFIILMFLFMFWYYSLSFYNVPLKKTFIPLGLCGLSFGLGAASKWICLYAGAGLAVIFFITIYRRWSEYSLALKNVRKATGEEKKYLNHIINSFSLNTVYTLLFCIGVFIVIPLIIYCLSYYPYWNAETETRKWYEIILSNQEAMFSYHSKLQATHPYQSDWYTWPVMQTPMFYYAGPQDAENMSAIYAFGNPIVWYAGLVATLAGFGIAIMRFFNGKLFTSKETLSATGFFGLFRAGDETDEDCAERDTRTLIFLIIGVACNLMPWMGVNRCIFIYHYFATVPFIIFFTVYLLRYITRYKVKAGSILTIALVVLAVFWFFMFRPLWTGTSVSRDFVGTWLHWQEGWFGYYFPKG